jgi:hypothetical protein
MPRRSPLRNAVRGLDVNQPVFNMRTFSSFYRQQAVGPQLLVIRVASAMGLLGLTLALVGLYGLVAYSVARRTREIGIRMAIGAARSDVVLMVLGQGMVLAATGILAGGVASVAVRASRPRVWRSSQSQTRRLRRRTDSADRPDSGGELFPARGFRRWTSALVNRTITFACSVRLRRTSHGPASRCYVQMETP